LYEFRAVDGGNLRLTPYPGKAADGIGGIQSSFQARAIYENIPNQTYWQSGKA
jgi:hypothetical protein